jgi:hypothetical protein
LEATDKSFEMRRAILKVFAIAKSLQMSALVKDRLALSPPDARPFELLFMRRSPMNMVKALEKKSEPTTCKAVFRDPENCRVVMKVMEPAMTLQAKDLTTDRIVVSVKVPPAGGSPT